MRTQLHRIGAAIFFLGIVLTPPSARGAQTDAAVLASVGATRASAISGPIISTSPPSISFGSVLVGQIATRPLSVSNGGVQDLSLTGVQSSNPRFTTSFSGPVVVPVGGSIELTVTFAPLDASVQTSTLTLVSNADNGTQFVPATGTGIPVPGGELGAGRVLVAPAGESAGDQFGISVASASDVNGDGYGDVIVGAWTNDTGGGDAGRAYIYLGGASPNDVPDRVLQGVSSGDNFGVSVASAGDVNGDGFADVVVGAYRNETAGTDAGRAYVYYGGPNMDAVPDLVFTGQGIGDFFGVSVSSAGDVNGDGFDDVVVGAFQNDVGGANAGRAYVFFGGPGADANADWVLTGAATGDNFGWSVSGAGDVNGDGYDDVMAASLQNDAGGIDAGRVYIYFGGLAPNNTPDWILTGEAAGNRFGVRVGAAGDVNGDGHPDVIVGADTYPGGAPYAGRAYVFHGGPAADTVADLVFTGDVPSGGFGAAVSSAGDVNGDGFADLLVGAWLDGTKDSAAGRAFLYHGGPAADAIADAVFSGEAAGDRFGDLVSTAGDFDGDGRDDIVIGAYFNDGFMEDAGRAYIVSVAEGNPPVVTAPSSIAGAVGALIAFQVTATDPEGGGLVSLTASPLPAGATFTANATYTSGDFAWTPAAAQQGTHTVVFTASNGAFGSATTTIVVSAGTGNLPPVVTGPASISAAEGAAISFAIQATDPEGDHVTLGALNRPVGSVFIDFGNNSGNFSWTPGFGQAGSYAVSFTGRDEHGGEAAPKVVSITIDDVNRGPSASPGGPYSGVVNLPIVFDGTGSNDPDGDPLTHHWSFGDLGTGAGPTPLHSYTVGGVFAVSLTVSDGSTSASASTSATVQDVFLASAFLEGGNVTTRLNSGKAATCVQIEPLDRAYANTDVSIASIVMISAGTGSVERIFAIADKSTIGADRNRNGIDEITACFAKADLRNLFSGLSGGQHTVGVDLEGTLTTGGTFRATLEMDVVASGNSLSASVSPNPLNPVGTITFRTTRPGSVSVTLFDAAGRLVRAVLSEPNLAAGYHDAPIDGRRGDGARLSSGVYFYRVQTVEGTAAGRFVVLK